MAGEAFEFGSMLRSERIACVKKQHSSTDGTGVFGTEAVVGFRGAGSYLVERHYTD